MPEEKLIPVNIVVADRTYRLRIKAEEEEPIRKVMKEVNAKIVEFKTSFAGKDLQDYIAMCLIWYASQSATQDSGPPEDIAMFLQKLEKDIDQALAGTEE